MTLRFQCEKCSRWFPGGRDSCPFCGEPVGEYVTAQGPAVDRLWHILHLRPKVAARDAASPPAPAENVQARRGTAANRPPKPDPCLVELHGFMGGSASESAWREARKCPEDCGRVCIRQAGLYEALRFRCKACGQWDLANYSVCPKCGRPVGPFTLDDDERGTR